MCLALEASKTELLGRTSYAGFITVDEKSNSNMYFWFFPSAVSNFSKIRVHGLEKSFLIFGVYITGIEI